MNIKAVNNACLSCLKDFVYRWLQRCKLNQSHCRKALYSYRQGVGFFGNFGISLLILELKVTQSSMGWINYMTKKGEPILS